MCVHTCVSIQLCFRKLGARLHVNWIYVGGRGTTGNICVGKYPNIRLLTVVNREAKVISNNEKYWGNNQAAFYGDNKIVFSLFFHLCINLSRIK